MKNLCITILVVLAVCSLKAGGKTLGVEDTEGKTLEELYLMRNEIFARHGRPFKTNELNTYFRSQEWYKMNMEFKDEVLSPEEIKLANAMRAKEKEMLKSNFITKEGTKKINLDNIINKWQFGDFSDQEKEKLSSFGFVVVPAKHEQFFYLYEKNRYLGIANFITTDAVLQLYHIFFDYTLRNLEAKKLYPIVKELTFEMIKESEKIYRESDNELLKEAALRNISYFSVPYYFLTKDSSFVNKEVLEIVKQEIKKCDAHQGRVNSLIFNPDNIPENEHKLDYSQFIPRGHYTRSEELKRYFLGMLWFGLNYFKANEDIDFVQSLLISHQLYKDREAKGRLIELWGKIYEPTVFYVGLSDDLGPPEYKKIIDQVYGNDPNPLDFVDSDKLEQAKKIAEDMFKKTKIKTAMVGIYSGPQFRFMGQRYIPDSEIFQRLVSWPERTFPKGLDIAAVLGSEEAEKILLEEYKENDIWEGYLPELQVLKKEFGSLDEEDWTQNLYYNWIYCLKALIDRDENFDYPFFMKNTAWERKELNTALASWSELRHDVILYAKQSGVECGDGEDWYPDPAKGFVEPNIVFFKRLNMLLSASKEGLKKRDLITEEMGKKFDDFLELVSFLEKVVEKEINKQPITKQEYQQIQIFGGLLENLTISVMVDDKYLRWFEITSETDKNIAVIADVHNASGEVLEVGVGPAYEIYVVVEIDGYLKLTRGAVFTYYEFAHPASDRLTDEKWQKMLKEGVQPPLPKWLEKFLSDKPAHNVPTPRYNYSTGC